MNKTLIALSAAMLATAPMLSQATPDEDLKAFRDYFHKKFPATPMNDFINGVYSIDPESREQWEAFEEFPSYETYIEKGEKLFNKPFANGKGFKDCFPNYKKGVRQN
jgi:sulfur-oxidizing protein SoxA